MGRSGRALILALLWLALGAGAPAWAASDTVSAATQVAKVAAKENAKQVKAAAAAPAAQAPAAAPASPAPASDTGPKAAAFDCIAADLPGLRGQLAKADPGTIMLSSAVVPGNANADVVYVVPSRSAANTRPLVFRAFLTLPDDPDLKKEKPRELDVLTVQHPPSTGAAAPFELAQTDSQNAYGVRLHIPDQGVIAARQERVLNVFACSRTDAGDVVVSWGVRPVTASTRLGGLIIALPLMVVIYLMAVTVVWAKRKTEAAQAKTGKKPPPPLRVTEVEHWSWWRCLDPVALTSDIFDRASLSKLQILLFSILVGFGATYAMVRTGSLSDLSTSIVYLLGIPSLGTVGAAAAGISRDRMSLDNWSWLVSKGVLPVNDRGQDKPRWVDLIMSDSELDLTKLQAVLFSLIVGIAMIESGFSNLGAFTVPPTLLEILGLSQVIFVGGRLTRPTTLGDLDDMLTELRTRLAQFVVAAKTGTDVDASGAPPLVAPAVAAAPVANLTAAATSIPVALRRYQDIATEVTILVQSLTHRSVKTAVLIDPTKL
jgi:hypothetical protein